MVIAFNGQKNDIGLSLKFEAKGRQVVDYSDKDRRYWEFSKKAAPCFKIMGRMRCYLVRRLNLLLSVFDL
jgi:hypothetical protein